MNKSEFINHIAKEHSCSKVEAERVINMFTSSTISALASGKEIILMGVGHNPKTGKPLTIKAYTQAKFSVGTKLKVACNK
ncbi:unnamed protein product [Oppiella nova]|uniref:HU family DNA-binding protein n=1 Tax=Oppiella nova TaxID=334625 RepID=A0A7R9QS36_9ACAR|nr:unnamed protein product [Oppiella nova]CAG2171884.1 unnamed protein product [Oppiella nova]